jgi:hypothetical protein
VRRHFQRYVGHGKVLSPSNRYSMDVVAMFAVIDSDRHAGGDGLQMRPVIGLPVSHASAEACEIDIMSPGPDFRFFACLFMARMLAQVLPAKSRGGLALRKAVLGELDTGGGPALFRGFEDFGSCHLV